MKKSKVFKVIEETEQAISDVSKNARGALEADAIKTVKAIGYEKIKSIVNQGERKNGKI